MSDDDAHISFSLDDIHTPTNNPNNNPTNECDWCNDTIIAEMLNDAVNTQLDAGLLFPQMIHYSENSTVKELLLICDYYGFAKEMKANKYNKDQIIQTLVEFEMNPHNNIVVCKRQTMWFYVNELKNDKFMKKFVLW